MNTASHRQSEHSVRKLREQNVTLLGCLFLLMCIFASVISAWPIAFGIVLSGLYLLLTLLRPWAAQGQNAASERFHSVRRLPTAHSA